MGRVGAGGRPLCVPVQPRARGGRQNGVGGGAWQSLFTLSGGLGARGKGHGLWYAKAGGERSGNRGCVSKDYENIRQGSLAKGAGRRAARGGPRPPGRVERGTRGRGRAAGFKGRPDQGRAGAKLGVRPDHWGTGLAQAGGGCSQRRHDPRPPLRGRARGLGGLAVREGPMLGQRRLGGEGTLRRAHISGRAGLDGRADGRAGGRGARRPRKKGGAAGEERCAGGVRGFQRGRAPRHERGRASVTARGGASLHRKLSDALAKNTAGGGVGRGEAGAGGEAQRLQAGASAADAAAATMSAPSGGPPAPKRLRPSGRAPDSKARAAGAQAPAGGSSCAAGGNQPASM